jgi:hypothetical protein
MPLITQSAVGSSTVVPGVANKFIEYSFGVGGGTYETDPLLVNQLPNLVYYIIQSAGVGPSQVLPQFSVRRVDLGGGTPQPEFLDLAPPILTPALTTPLVLTYQFPANLIRLKFVAPAGQVTEFKLILGAFA